MSLKNALSSFFADRKLPGVTSVYLFGSEAEGRAHRESDVDLAILLNRGMYPGSMDRADLALTLNAELVGVLRRNEIDLVVLNDAPPELGRAIVRKGIRVYCCDPEADHAFLRDIQLRAADLEPFLRRTRSVKLRQLRK